MGSIAYRFAAGDGFFAGLALTAAAALLAAVCSRKAVQRGARLVAVAGAILVAVSGTPQPLWAYLVWCGIVCAWLVGLPLAVSRRPAIVLGAAAIACCIAFAVRELPWRAAPRIPVGGAERIFVLGDSVSAGLNDSETAWPELLDALAPAEVVNVSRPGLTTAGARDLAGAISGEPVVVLLEIGGNDLLGGLRARDFERHLEALLTDLSGRGRTVAVFELPVPPFLNAYGRAQRRAADRHGAVLIPKRIFAGILGTPELTLDGIHLSPAGHRAMAQAVAGLLESGVPAGQPGTASE